MATPPIWAATERRRARPAMTVQVLAFARLRELLGFGARSIVVADGTTLEQLWEQLARGVRDAGALRSSTRFARNGALCEGVAVLREGDEVALLPPVGGG